MHTRRFFLAALGLVSFGVAVTGCDTPLRGSGDYPTTIVAVSAPESLIANDPVPVVVYSQRYNCGVGTRPTTFRVIDDTTFAVTLRQTIGNEQLGCPSIVAPDTYSIPHAPPRQFLRRADRRL